MREEVTLMKKAVIWGNPEYSGPETPGIGDTEKPLLEGNNDSGSARILHTCNT